MHVSSKSDPTTGGIDLKYQMLQWGVVMLLILFWGAATLVVLRCRQFSLPAAGLSAYLLLAAFVSGTILLLRFLERNPPKKRILLIAGPGALVGLFLVLPGCRFLGILLYCAVYLSTVGLILPGVKSATQEEREDDEEESFPLSEWDENVRLRLLRKKDETGTETLESWIRADFRSGERTVSVHVPFCPVFEGSPRIDAVPFEGEEVEIGISQLTPLGVRLDVKRPGVRKTPESVGIYVCAAAANRESEP